jgi:hypothetical protein
VGFRFPEALAGRIEGDGLGIHERAQVRQPALGARDVVIQHNEEAVRKILCERRDRYRVAGAMEAADGEPRGGRGHRRDELRELPERFYGCEQLWERHGAR